MTTVVRTPFAAIVPEPLIHGSLQSIVQLLSPLRITEVLRLEQVVVYRDRKGLHKRVWDEHVSLATFLASERELLHIRDLLGLNLGSLLHWLISFQKILLSQLQPQLAQIVAVHSFQWMGPWIITCLLTYG